MEGRASAAGLRFSPGRTRRSSSHLALEAIEFSTEQHRPLILLRPLFKAYFERLEDIGDIETLVRIGSTTGLSQRALREALELGSFCERVDDGVAWARAAGIRSVPTFIFDEKYAIEGAQEWEAFQEVMAKLGHEPRPA